MITKNDKESTSAKNSRIGKVYQSLQTRLNPFPCPNCWGTQEYGSVILGANDLLKK